MPAYRPRYTRPAIRRLRAMWYNIRRRGLAGGLLAGEEKVLRGMRKMYHKRLRRSTPVIQGRKIVNSFVNVKGPLLHVTQNTRQYLDDIIENYSRLGARKVAASARKAIHDAAVRISDRHLMGQTNERIKRGLRPIARHFGVDFPGDMWSRGKPTQVITPFSIKPKEQWGGPGFKHQLAVRQSMRALLKRSPQGFSPEAQQLASKIKKSNLTKVETAGAMTELRRRNWVIRIRKGAARQEFEQLHTPSSKKLAKVIEPAVFERWAGSSKKVSASERRLSELAISQYAQKAAKAKPKVRTKKSALSAAMKRVHKNYEITGYDKSGQAIWEPIKRRKKPGSRQIFK